MTENPRTGPRDPSHEWVPIRSLGPHHRPRIEAHLLALDEHDRYLRFGYPATDEQIVAYVRAIDFERDEVFGIFNRKLALVALAHLAFAPPETPSNEAEFGVSVAAYARGRGWGARLFELAMLHARNRHVDTLIIYALSENTAMLRVARRFGAKLAVEGPDATARLKLPPEDFASHFEAAIRDQVAEFDYGLKRQAQRWDAWLGRFTG
jgi:RimJ/RimL family protein N-acetyltransferase